MTKSKFFSKLKNKGGLFSVKIKLIIRFKVDEATNYQLISLNNLDNQKEN